MKTIPIFFAVDGNYIPFLATALASAIDCSSPDRSYRATVLYEKVNERDIGRITALQRDNFKIDFIPVTSGLDTITDRLSNRLRFDCFTLTIYFRLFVPEMFPQYNKAIYLDSDVIVTHDLADLYDTDIADNYVGACTDISIRDNTELTSYIRKYVGVDHTEYVNSGVLLMNLAKMRENGFTKHFLTLLNAYHFDSVAPDQDYINAICNGKIHYLDCRWNAMPDCPVSASPFLIHYNLYNKPWHYDEVRYGEYFRYYESRCGFTEEIAKARVLHTDEEKMKDKERMATLVRRAMEISVNTMSFKKVLEDGVKIRL